MWVICLKDTIHDSPIDIRTNAIKRDPKLLSDTATRSIASYEKLGMNGFLLARSRISNNSSHWVIRRRILSDLEISNCRAALNQFLMPQQISDVYSLQLPLGNDVKTTISRV